MARIDGKFEAAAEAKLDIDELFAALPGAGEAVARGRQDAIACFLSAAEGWEDARERLRGSFAAASRASWLRDGKE
ncbi:MAG TPA: hypothetical protein VGD23_05065 [Sphingomicrobium sp.]